MESLLNLLPLDLLTLLERGGPVFWLILLISVLMWSLIAHCYLHLWLEPRGKQMDCSNRLPMLTAMVQILPMVGLLGTVEGMIDVFHVIATLGAGHIRGMAAGISTALITTMAGLVTSLSGLFFVSDLKHRMAEPAGQPEAV